MNKRVIDQHTRSIGGKICDPDASGVVCPVSDRSRNRSRNGSRPDNRQGQRQKNGGQQGAAASQPGQKSSSPKAPVQGRKAEGSQAAVQSAAKASQPPKKGFLARLKGLFGGAKASSDTSDNK